MRGSRVEVSKRADMGYVGVRVCPRGIASETVVFVARAHDEDAVAGLDGYVAHAEGCEPDDGYRAEWVGRRELHAHLIASRDGYVIGWDGRPLLLVAV